MSQLESLLAPTQQPELLPAPAVFTETLEAEGKYTGERLHAQRPNVYTAIVRMLSEGHGSQYIADTLRAAGERCSQNTVRAVRRREGDTIDALRDRLAVEQFEFAAQADEAASLVLTEIMESRGRRSALTVRDVQSLKVASGIAITNGQLLSGKPTVNVSMEMFVRPSSDLNEQLAAHIASLKDASTHSTEEKSAQKGAADAVPMAVPTDLVGSDQTEPPIASQADGPSEVTAT